MSNSLPEPVAPSASAIAASVCLLGAVAVIALAGFLAPARATTTPGTDPHDVRMIKIDARITLPDHTVFDHPGFIAIDGQRATFSSSGAHDRESSALSITATVVSGGAIEIVAEHEHTLGAHVARQASRVRVAPGKHAFVRGADHMTIDLTARVAVRPR